MKQPAMKYPKRDKLTVSSDEAKLKAEAEYKKLEKIIRRRSKARASK